VSSEVLSSVFDVQDKVVLVTGGASGLGLAIARVLAECGAIVVIVDWNETRLAQAADTHPAGARIEQAALDVSDAGAVSSFVGDIVDRHGRLDVAFANAGIALGRGPGDPTGLIDSFDLV
jgi:NAD(P)-dependent dehydrogenase (short-subunit alcohol dehydrogenase family)